MLIQLWLNAIYTVAGRSSVGREGSRFCPYSRQIVKVRSRKQVYSNSHSATNELKRYHITGPKCLGGPGKAIHETLHALGIFHEQSRADRDDYVTLNRENVIKRKKFLEHFQHILRFISFFPSVG